MVLNCKTRSLHFSYLGLPIGGESRKIDFWNPLIDCIKSRLPVWKSGNLSIGGRLVFLKFSCLLYRYILFPSSVLPHVPFFLSNLFLIVSWGVLGRKKNLLLNEILYA